MANQVNILIVEDEMLLAEDIKLRLERLGYRVVAYVPSVSLAMEKLKDHSEIDLALVDISLKGRLDGIDLAKVINSLYRIPFIFLTSHADKALVERAKEVRPYAYMLKPFNDREIAINVEMALANFAQQRSETGPGLGRNSFGSDENQVLNINQSLFLKKDHHFQRVALKDITILEADNNYTTVYTRADRYIYSTVLKRMEEKLPGKSFLRVHRSYVVNIEAITGFEGNTLFVGEKQVPVSKQYKVDVFKIFNTL
jgi:DNA-binding LytR/AlgR family response regulator